VIDRAWIAEVKAALPELPGAMKARFEQTYALPAYDAAMLTQSRETARYFEDAVRAFGGEAKTVANWMLGELAAALNKAEIDVADAPVGPTALAALLRRIGDGTISGKIAKDVFDAMWAGEARGENAADAIIANKGLRQISDAGAIEKIVDEVLAANPAIVAEFRAGKEKAFNSLVGKAMAATKGKANPAQVNAMLKAKLG
jgi:aspartyl-tRNA(Asn)/glutamyl-tRNA(Gln) amidotransferase subunit B